MQGWVSHSMAILPFPCLAEGECVICLWEVIISLGTVGCGLDKARRMSLNVLLWWLDYRQLQNKPFTSFLLLFNLEKSFFQTSGKPLFRVRITPSLKYLDQEGRGHNSCSSQSSGWSLLRVHQHCQMPGLEFLISAGCCRAGSFPFACQRSKHASLYPAGLVRIFSFKIRSFPPQKQHSPLSSPGLGESLCSWKKCVVTCLHSPLSVLLGHEVCGKAVLWISTITSEVWPSQKI